MLRRDNIFTIVSLMLGILAFITITSIILPVILGSLAVIFAILSKGSSKKMTGKSIAGFFMGLGAVFCSVGIVAGTIYLFINNDEYRAEFNNAYKAAYGVSFDEYMDEMMLFYESGELPDDSAVIR